MTFSISFFKPGKYRFLWLIFSSWNFIFVIHLFFSLSLSLSLSLIYKSLGLNLFWLYVLFFFCCSVLFSNHYLFLCWSVCFTSFLIGMIEASSTHVKKSRLWKTHFVIVEMKRTNFIWMNRIFQVIYEHFIKWPKHFMINLMKYSRFCKRIRATKNHSKKQVFSAIRICQFF